MLEFISRHNSIKRASSISSFLASEFFISSIIALGGTSAAMMLGYFFHFVMVRMLSLSDYGELSVLIAIMTVVTVPSSAIQTIFTREVSKLDAAGKTGAIFAVCRQYTLTIFFKTLALSAILLLAMLFASFVYPSSYYLYFAVLLVFTPILYLVPISRAYLQGRENIFALSALFSLDMLLRLAFGIALILIGLNLFGAFLSLVLPALIVTIPFIVYFFNSHKNAKPLQITFTNSLLPMLATMVMMALFIYSDLFFVRHYLSSESAGYYNVAGISARILGFIMNGLLLVFLPKSSKLSYSAGKQKLIPLLLKTTLFIIPVFLFFVLFPTQFISLFYTEKYVSAALPFIILSIGMFAYAIASLLINVMWSQKDEKFPMILMFGVLAVDLCLLFLLVPSYGLTGAASATAFASLLLAAGAIIHFTKKLS
ncbi:MAG: polysaccharide biosynthesis C-terminal domain-containing protein [Candidatus Omnitrophica bacterium]|nr:polysaccharide biosynthesis C-terminal domain-containing protein [Candidatus Omnitrophota bacterium]